LEHHEGYGERIQEHRIQEVLLALSGVGVVFTPSAYLSWAERVQRLVAQRPAEPWDCEGVARIFHLSASSLQRRLAEENHSLAACVRESRMHTAMGLLQSTDRPIGDIAQACGYRSVSKFSAAFRQRFGTLPSGMR
jgi:AraC-like DNA-binding protein